MTCFLSARVGCQHWHRFCLYQFLTKLFQIVVKFTHQKRKANPQDNQEIANFLPQTFLLLPQAFLLLPALCLEEHPVLQARSQIQELFPKAGEEGLSAVIVFPLKQWDFSVVWISL